VLQTLPPFFKKLLYNEITSLCSILHWTYHETIHTHTAFTNLSS